MNERRPLGLPDFSAAAHPVSDGRQVLRAVDRALFRSPPADVEEVAAPQRRPLGDGGLTFSDTTR